MGYGARQSQTAAQDGPPGWHGPGREDAAIQVICLGSGGGPVEDNVTGFLMRSTASNWSKGSLLALDAGSHLSSISRILQRDFPAHAREKKTLTTSTTEPRKKSESSLKARSSKDSPSESGSTAGDAATRPAVTPSSNTRQQQKASTITLDGGPFAGLPFPATSFSANAVHVVREHVSTYLITHPHLDHLSGFAINTAAFHNTSRPKRLAALPSTVNAIKTHIFNDIIWPNLTDEDGGVGFVTFQRLTEGGNIALGEGHGRGYIEVCNGLGVKGYHISHGHNLQTPPHLLHGRNNSTNTNTSAGEQASSTIARQSSFATSGGSIAEARKKSLSGASRPDTPGFSSSAGVGVGGASGSISGHGQQHQHADLEQQNAAYTTDSAAFFVRDEASGKEILFFGDVEPDSIALTPRTHRVWDEAAPKIAAGTLAAIFIECSYTDSQGDAILFGHLAPRHLIAELGELAAKVRQVKEAMVVEGVDGDGSSNSVARGQDENEPVGTGMAVMAESAATTRKRKRAQAAAAAAAASNSTATDSKRDIHGSRSVERKSNGTAKQSATLTPSPNTRTSTRSTSRRRGRSQARTSTTTSTPTGPPALQSATNGTNGTNDTNGTANSNNNNNTTYTPEAQNEHERENESETAIVTDDDPMPDAPPHANTTTTKSYISKTGTAIHHHHQPESTCPARDEPLKGLRVIVTHIKDTMVEGVDDAETIREQLLAHEERLRGGGGGLGCEFEISVASGSYWF